MLQTRWKLLIVSAIFMQVLLSAGPLYNYNVFFVHLRDEFQTSAAFTAWVGSLAASLASLAAPLAAVIGSVLGNFRVILLGLALACSGYITTSFIPSLEYGYSTYGLMVGLGSGFMYNAAACVMMNWFSGKKGYCRAAGLAMTGASVGVMVFGPLLNTGSDAYGWKNCLRILSGVCLILGLVTVLPLMKRPESPQTQDEEAGKRKRGFQNRGQLSDKDCTTEESTGSDREQEADACEDVNIAVSESSSRSGMETLLLLVLNAEVWLCVLSLTFAQLGWSFVIVNYTSFMQEINLTTDQISLALLVFGAAEVGGKALFAVFGDSLPCLKLYCIVGSSFGAAIISAILMLCSTYQHMIIISTGWGVCRGIIYGSYFVAGDELFKIYGSWAVTSVASIGIGLGGLLGAPITGFLHDATGDYSLSLYFLVGTFVFSVLCMLLIPAKRAIQSQRRGCQSTADNNQTDAEVVGVEDKPKARNVGTSNHAYEIET